MLEVNDYKLIYKSNCINLYRIWLTLILVFIVGFLIINKCFKYNELYYLKGECINSNIEVYVPVNDIKKITRNTKIIYENKEFAYKVNSISKENIYMNGMYLKKVNIRINKFNTKENNVIDINIVTDSSSLIEYIFKTIWR